MDDQPAVAELNLLPDLIEPVDKSLLLTQAASSVKWTTLATLLPRFVTPVSTMILAALLTPADFGAIAVSTLVVALARIVVGLGLGPSVVQRRDRVGEAASAALYMSLLVAILLYGALWLSAPWLAQAYRIPVVESVVRVSGISLILYALESIPMALLQRELRFRRFFWVNFTPQLVNVAVSLALAALGAGVWALVIGPLAGAAARAALAWALSGWRPLRSLDRALVSQLLGFSLWLVVAGFQSWLFLQADNALAGVFLGGEGLGVYSLGFNLSALLPGLIIPPLATIAYPAFCTLQNQREEVGRSLLKLQSLAAALLLPAALGLSAVAVPAVKLLYGDKWAGLGSVIQLLALNGIGQIWSLNSETYRAIGRPDAWPKLALIPLAVLFPLLLAAGPYGLLPFTVARFAAGFVLPLTNIAASSRILGISIKKQVWALMSPGRYALVMYVLALLLVSWSAPFEGFTGWLKLGAIVSGSALFYVGLVWRFNRSLWSDLVSAARRIVLRV